MRAQNQKTFKAFTKSFDQKLEKEVKKIKKVLSKSEIAQLGVNLINSEFLGKEERETSNKELMKILLQNEELILDQQEKIKIMKKKIQFQDEITNKYFQQVLKDKSSEESILFQRQKKNKTSRSFLQFYLPPMINDIQLIQSIVRSTCQTTKQNLDSNSIETPGFRQCTNSRLHSENSLSKYQITQYPQEQQTSDKSKQKALAKLRKIEKYMMRQENKNEKIKENRWNYGYSPTKKYYRQDRSTLKEISTNLTPQIESQFHLQKKGDKFCDYPSVEGLTAKEETLKKKETILRQLDETLTKKQYELNRKQTQFTKRQKSTKLL